MSVNEKMTAIANAIREKTGGTDLLTLDGMAELIASIEAGGGGGDIWGGKYTTGSFVLAEETTSAYTIATNTDEAMVGLLNDGESITTIYNSIGLMVLRKPTDTFKGSSYPKCLLGTVYFPTYYGSGAGSSKMAVYSDTYGSPRASTEGAVVNFNNLQVVFTSYLKGSPDFEYMWLAWRHLK